jgi:hypothetical protein
MFFLTGELYDLSQLKSKKKIKILIIKNKNKIIEFDKKIQTQLIKKASKKNNTLKIKSCKPYTFYEKVNRFIITVIVSNKSSGLFFLDKENIGRLFSIHCSTRKYNFAEKKTGDVVLGWNFLLKKINPISYSSKC